MKILQLGACALGKHVRDRKRVWHDGVDYRTYCSGCSKPMLREADGWAVIAAHPTPPPPRKSKAKADKPPA